MGLDWKQDVETLEWRIESALTGNFGMSADLPDFRTYGNKSISAPSVFADYDNALRREGFQLGFKTWNVMNTSYLSIGQRIGTRRKMPYSGLDTDIRKWRIWQYEKQKIGRRRYEI